MRDGLARATMLLSCRDCNCNHYYCLGSRSQPFVQMVVVVYSYSYGPQGLGARRAPISGEV